MIASAALGARRMTASAGALALAGGASIGVLATVVADDPVLGLAVIAGLVVAAGFLDLSFGLGVAVGAIVGRATDVAAAQGLPDLAPPVAVTLALVAWVSTRGRIDIGRPAVLFGLYGVVLLSSTIWATSASVAISETALYARDMAIALGVFVVVSARRALHAAVWGIVGSGAALAAINLFQAATGTYANDYGGFAEAALKNIVGDLDAHRIGGPFQDPNFLAQFMVVVVPLALDRFRHEDRFGLRLTALAATLGSLAVIFVTFSRGALVGLAAIGVMLLIRTRPSLPALIGIGAGLTFAFAVAPPEYQQRATAVFQATDDVASADDAAVRNRASEMVAALEMWTDHPIGGVGLGNYNINYVDYAEELQLDFRRETRSAHSLPLEVAAETGLLGIAAFGALVLAALRTLIRARRAHDRADRHAQASLLFSVEAALVGYLATAVFLHNAYPRLLWVLLAIALASAPAPAPAPDEAQPA